ncbi:MAG: S-adenosylmethionine:tRNA ribosyltransferase-isomerase, partial [Epsilonproteobacteria bacterium]|nr:S-adenosylmethionine:tRNA ribosyltransferase-isomerase [Campylobacterota bacterium]
MPKDPLLVDSYDYKLPSHLIASTPAEPRDSCRLLIYDRQNDTIIHERFY